MYCYDIPPFNLKDEKITSGLVSTVALYEGILIVKESIDLCEVVSKYSQCPLQPGQTVVLQSEMTPVPNYILSVSISLKPL